MDKTQPALPHSLQIISECLEDMAPPDGPFDPEGEWENRYLAWVALRGPAGKSWDAGGLRIRRRVTPNGAVLTVDHSCKLRDAGKTAVAHAVINCEDDLLSTPRSWEMVSYVVHAQSGEVPLTRTKVSGSMDGDKLISHDGVNRGSRFAGLFTSNWTLFDAIQRMPSDMEPLQFDLLEGLEVVKRSQVIRPGETVDVDIQNRSVRLHSFEHIGEGILPYTYWLDENNRLLMAVGGLCTYLYDADAQIPLEPR